MHCCWIKQIKLSRLGLSCCRQPARSRRLTALPPCPPPKSQSGRCCISHSRAPQHQSPGLEVSYFLHIGGHHLGDEFLQVVVGEPNLSLALLGHSTSLHLSRAEITGIDLHDNGSGITATAHFSFPSPSHCTSNPVAAPTAHQRRTLSCRPVAITKSGCSCCSISHCISTQSA